MEKVNTALIRAESIEGQVVGATLRGEDEDLIELIETVTFLCLNNRPNSRKALREALRSAFRDTRPRLGDVLLEKLTKHEVDE